MTPRHLVMFCVAQFASIAGGILCAYTSRKFFARWRDWGEIYQDSVPIWPELIINHGWLLVVIPIACVLLIPRHREDDDTGSVNWRWQSATVVALGMIVLLALPLGVTALVRSIQGPKHHIIYHR